MVNLSFADPVMRPAEAAPPGAPNELASLMRRLNNARVVCTAQTGPGLVAGSAAARARLVGDNAVCHGGIHRSPGPLARGRVR